MILTDGNIVALSCVGRKKIRTVILTKYHDLIKQRFTDYRWQAFIPNFFDNIFFVSFHHLKSIEVYVKVISEVDIGRRSKLYREQGVMVYNWGLEQNYFGLTFHSITY